MITYPRTGTRVYVPDGRIGTIQDTSDDRSNAYVELPTGITVPYDVSELREAH